MKPLSLFVLALALFSLRPVASAQTSPPLMTIDAVSVGFLTMTVTGIVQGQAAPSTHAINFLTGGSTAVDSTIRAAAFEACHRQLMLALSRPGQYLLEKTSYSSCSVVLIAP